MSTAKFTDPRFPHYYKCRRSILPAANLDGSKPCLYCGGEPGFYIHSPGAVRMYLASKEERHSESLSPAERVAARHYLQVMKENAVTLRNAMDPNHGVPTVQRALFLKDLDAIQHLLDEMRKDPITINKLPGDGQ